MKKLTTATIATLGLVTFGAATADDASAAEQLNTNDQYTTTYSQSTGDYVTVDANGNKHHTLDGNWNPSMFNNGEFKFYVVDENGAYNYYYYSSENADYDYATENTSVATPVFENTTSVDNADYNYNAQSANYVEAVPYTTSNANYTQQPAAAPANNAGYNYTTTTTTTTTTTAPAATNAPAATGLTYGKGGQGNLYTAGQCTYYAYERSGGRVGSLWGNANNWANAARSAGYTVNNTPAVGAIMQTTAGGYGHVAYVENVGSNGSVTVSEMNYTGVGQVSTRTLSASQAASHNFIH
ncbi:MULTISPECIES: CHAP domain-containing protein [unclassified Staphylococcus]|uniref:CHAP domain-containing protein n=1 Tax=unclassified Staphylococcus TaxID=91994 RepID=UPI0021CFB2F0|nr:MULTISPECIES: CHAP domain-containing protein [unclassified Staphylococcus]UXR69444.1 CHAP domain-containing protein [Staphylococcus sp. IVB6246]UXR71499.1 CHAP domain-containing protein [Staphylococcus sp. IVB6240]UXR73777.1 CHAP domain-containing protein [Staphylococcus sp. IVB6238]UXR76096.1 CHAP domain-containing protein [Staphylococcus sp. IVB6233]UXR80294.1 CHAP domain-containing protein [Staphylococcus sp. IVB6218]